MAKLRLDYDDYQEEQTSEQEQKQKMKMKLKQKQAKRRKAYVVPYREAEDGWMMVSEGLDEWDFREEIGAVLPD